MIRARLTSGQFIFGIDAENARRLMNGEPIFVDMTLLGGSDKFLLIYAKTTTELIATLEEANGGPLPAPMPMVFNEPSKGH